MKYINLRKMITCRKCGKMFEVYNFNYCPYCGIELVDEVTDKDMLEKALKDIEQLKKEIADLRIRIPLYIPTYPQPQPQPYYNPIIWNADGTYNLCKNNKD